MNKDRLRQAIKEEIDNFAPSYRCHEGARLIALKLKSMDMDVSVRDGVVIYDTSCFMKDFFDDFLSDFFSDDLSDEEREGLEKELAGEKPKDRIGVLHSWCEIKDDLGDIVVVDWHAYLNLSSTCGVQNQLIVENKDDLPHVYIPMGKTIGKWIIFPVFPPRVARLRI